MASATELYLLHAAEIRSFIALRVICRETAKELTHESFIRYLALGGAAVGNPRALLYRIASNLAIDHFRQARSRAGLNVNIDSCCEQVCPAPGPEQIAIARRTLDRLARAIETLPLQRRRVFMRCRFDGCSHAQVAAEFGISRSTVEKHVVRSLLDLRLAMEDPP